MKKRVLLGVLTIVCLLALTVGLTACGHQHTWSGYAYDATGHWRTCQTCGAVAPGEHDFCATAPDSGLAELCECGAHQGEFASFRVNFVLDEGVGVRVYRTQDAAGGGALPIWLMRVTVQRVPC